MDMIIGLTGGIGSGKSAVGQIFRQLKVEVLDSDQITRQLVEPNQPAQTAIIEHFGPQILLKDGSLNRAKLRSIIFESPEEKKWLEKLLHPLVKEQVLKLREILTPGNYIVIEIPLLIEADFQDAVDRILVIDCSEELQKERVMKRDGMPAETLKNILKSQTDRSTRLRQATDVIVNEGSKEELKTKVLNLHHYYHELAK